MTLPDQIVPPTDTDAEAAVLGGLLLDNERVDDVLAMLPSADVFSLDAHRGLYAALVGLHRAGAPLDLVTVKDALRRAKSGGEDAVGLVVDLAQSVPSAANVCHYAKIVADLHRRREVMRTMHKGYSAVARPNGDDLADVAGGIVRSIADALDYGTVGELEPIDRIAARTLEPTERGQTLPSGIPLLKDYGPTTGSYIVLGARPSVGKTSLLAQIALETAKAGKHVLLISQEQPPDEIGSRLLSRLSGISTFDLKQPELRNGRAADVKAAQQTLTECAPFLHLAGRQSSIEAMTALVNRTRRRVGKLSLVAVDYLQLCHARGQHQNRNDELSRISGEVASWRHDGPAVIAASQLNREVTKRGSGAKPTLADLRDCGAIEQDADAVWLLHEKDRGTGPSARKVELLIEKNRSGPCGSVDLTFWPSAYTFKDTDTMPLGDPGLAGIANPF